jgi:hypothetical protein
MHLGSVPAAERKLDAYSWFSRLFHSDRIDPTGQYIKHVPNGPYALVAVAELVGLTAGSRTHVPPSGTAVVSSVVGMGVMTVLTA